MGQSVPFLIMRAVTIIAAGLLLFVAFNARAQGYGGYGTSPAGGEISNYGRVPLPEPVGPAYSPAAATNNSYNAAPVVGGYYPPQVGNYGAAPVATTPPPAAASFAAPASDGYVPVAGGYTAPPAPARQAAPPVYQQQAAAAGTPYGYKRGDGTPMPAATLPQDSAYNYYQGAAATNGVRPNADYVLGPGDKLKLTVFEEADLSGDYTIDGIGFLRLPLAGQVRAAGLNSTQLEGAIAAQLARGYLKQPRVSVQVATYRPFYIIGAVAKPGEYPYVNNMTALNAIALAGGFTPSAVESAVYIRREGSNNEVKMPVDRSTSIRPGDVVRVNTTMFADVMQLINPLSTPLSIAAAAAVP